MHKGRYTRRRELPEKSKEYNYSRLPVCSWGGVEGWRWVAAVGMGLCTRVEWRCQGWEDRVVGSRSVLGEDRAVRPCNHRGEGRVAGLLHRQHRDCKGEEEAGLMWMGKGVAERRTSRQGRMDRSLSQSWLRESGLYVCFKMWMEKKRWRRVVRSEADGARGGEPRRMRDGPRWRTEVVMHNLARQLRWE